MVATHQVREVSPIPPGRYWILVTGAANVHDFDTWVRDMAGAVKVETSETAPEARSVFVIFRVPEGRSPFLSAPQFGFPNNAPPEVHSADDVESVPDISSPTGPNLSDLALPVGGGLALVVILLLLSGALQGSSSRRYRAA